MNAIGTAPYQWCQHRRCLWQSLRLSGRRSSVVHPSSTPLARVLAIGPTGKQDPQGRIAVRQAQTMLQSHVMSSMARTA